METAVAAAGGGGGGGGGAEEFGGVGDRSAPAAASKESSGSAEADDDAPWERESESDCQTPVQITTSVQLPQALSYHCLSVAASLNFGYETIKIDITCPLSQNRQAF